MLLSPFRIGNLRVYYAHCWFTITFLLYRAVATTTIWNIAVWLFLAEYTFEDLNLFVKCRILWEPEFLRGFLFLSIWNKRVNNCENAKHQSNMVMHLRNACRRKVADSLFFSHLPLLNFWETRKTWRDLGILSLTKRQQKRRKKKSHFDMSQRWYLLTKAERMGRKKHYIFGKIQGYDFDWVHFSKLIVVPHYICLHISHVYY